MQHGHKVRICVSVVHLLADEVKNLGGALSVYMYLESEKNTSSKRSDALQIAPPFPFLLTDSKRLARASSSSFRSISK